MVRRCGFCREEGHDRRRCAGWIQHQQREREQTLAQQTLVQQALAQMHMRQGIWSGRQQAVIDLSDDYAEIPANTPPGSPPRTPPRTPPRMRSNSPPNAPPRIEANQRPGHRPTSFPNTGGQGRVGPIIHIRAVGTNLGNRFEEVADSIANTLVGMRTNTQTSPKLVKLSNKVIEATSCAICIEDLGETNKLITRCGHQFCCGCMFTHMRTKNFCPTCRGILA